jgi:hypothetical protein
MEEVTPESKEVIKDKSIKIGLLILIGLFVFALLMKRKF